MCSEDHKATAEVCVVQTLQGRLGDADQNVGDGGTVGGAARHDPIKSLLSGPSFRGDGRPVR